MSTSVVNFFAAAAFSPASQLKINHRERSTALGDALVQSAIEYSIKSRLSSGQIKLINPNQVLDQIEYIKYTVPQCSKSYFGVRCLILNPIAPRVNIDIVKSALLREKVRFFSTRILYGGAIEVTVEDSPVVDRLLTDGLILYNNWFTRVTDATKKRCHKKYTKSVCFLCNERGHVQVMCIQQKPDRPSAYGG
jgi:hypothetical protein